MHLIATDLDGTLLNHKNEISNANADAIRYAQSRGIEVVISTGRSYFDAISICNKANISTYIIGNNGATIHDKEANQIYAFSINRKEVEEITQWLESKDFYYEVSTNNSIYTPLWAREMLILELDQIIRSNPDIDAKHLYSTAEKQFSQLGFVFVNDYKSIIEKKEDYYNILAFSFDDAKRKMGFEYFNRMNTLSTFSSADHNFEIVHSSVSKGNALEQLAQRLHISLEKTMAIGDSYNDISMFHKAHYSVAMGNAKDDIKSLCKFTTKTNDEDGVAYIIHTFLHKCEPVCTHI
jgi:Cof subfamily protein (haloacid dehalogenase superfamily)